MKKIFTLTTLLVLALTVNAQGYRKWNFTNWSSTTIANLEAEAATGGQLNGSWSDIEKNTSGATTPGNNVCFWSYGSNVSEDGYLMANGAVIAETEGLVWNTAYTSRRSLAIAVDYSSTSLGDYNGAQYLWLGGGNAKSASARIACFTIPKVRIGQKITISAESHKPSDARGVSLFVNDCTDDANQIGESFKPTTYESYTWEDWTLPEGVTADGETVDIVVYNTNGCHLYSIEVGEESQKSKVAYLYNGTLSDDIAYGMLSTDDRFTLEAKEASATLTFDELTAYDGIVISATANDDAIAALKTIRPFVPTLNLNPSSYAVWGYGTVDLINDKFLVAKNPNSPLFRNIDMMPDPDTGEQVFAFTSAESISGVTLTGIFANDDTLATDYTENATKKIAIHAHNMNHNGYLYVPYKQETLAGGNALLLGNALSMVVGSKAKVSQATKPTITLDYKNQNTNVVIKSTVPAAEIFYTIDGSEPTEQSTPYTEPFNIATEGVTVKAVVKGEGYLLSDVAEKLVDLKNQAATPTISVSQKKGYAIVELSCATEGVSIFYNYDANTDSTNSTRYTEPIILMTNKTISVFAGNAEYVLSETASKEVTIEEPVTFTETLSHMDANKEEYYQKYYDSEDKPNSDSNSKVAYFFTWGKSKNAYSYYDTTADPISTTIDPETGDEVSVYPKSAEQKYDFGNGWAIRSRGQVICTEITVKPGTSIGVGTAYNPATVDEFEFADTYPCTDFYVNLSEWNTADPRSAMIYSTQKFKGPFAVLSYISNGNAGTGPMVVFETGKDIDGDAVDTEWNQIGDTCVLDKGQRLYQKFVRFYTGTDEVYLRTRIADGGSKAGFYDIYVLNYTSEAPNGIQDVKDTVNGLNNEAIYSLSGVRIQKMQRGLNIVRNSNGAIKKIMVK